MKFLGLLSGGKDSMFAVGQALKLGHELVCIGNIYSPEEKDSYMFQTAGTLALTAISQSMKVPLIARCLLGGSFNREMHYSVTENDETEDLYELVLEAKIAYPQIEAVVTGAVFSDYQRIRVENVCSRLGLASLSPLWRMDQNVLLDRMEEEGYESILIKVASMGLTLNHLSQGVLDLKHYFEGLKNKFQFHIAGEGGEYESLITNCPLMHKKLIVSQSEVVDTGHNTGYLKLCQIDLQDKETGNIETIDLQEQSLPRLYTKISEFYTPEITASALGRMPTSFEHETFIVMKGLKEMLLTNGHSLRDVYYIVAYISDMSNYIAFNTSYTKFINFANPPSRVCVEIANQECGVKLVAKGSSLPAKKCTHVQSISPWAPANIGPYSQAYKIQGALHLAGGIALDPMTMQLTEPALDRILTNIQAVASLNQFNIENPATCFAYYTGTPPEIPENYNAFLVKTTNLPKNASLELEMHLEDNVKLEKSIEDLRGIGFAATVETRKCSDLVYMVMYVTILEMHRPEEVLDSLKEKMNLYFDSVKHKSPVNAQDLLTKSRVETTVENYVTDVRVYHPDPKVFHVSWLKATPSVFVTSETSGIYIEIKDLEQLHTYQFIQSGN